MQGRRRRRVAPEVKEEIRRRALFSPQVELARDFGLTRSTICKMLKGCPKCPRENIAAKRPAPETQPPTVAVIRVASWLRAAAKARGFETRIVTYLLELAHSDYAEQRSAKLFDAPLKPEDMLKVPVEIQRKRDENAIISQRVLHLRDQNLPVAIIAQRCKIGLSTVRRIIATHDAAAIRIPHATRATTHGQRWGDSGGRAQEAQP